MNADVKHILIPTDLSEFATLALRYGNMFAERLDTRLTLLYAADLAETGALIEHPLGYYFEERPDEVLALQEKVFEKARQSGLLVDREDVIVVKDQPARAIVEVAKSRRADMIVMGTHGRGGWRRAVMGSVAERVLHEAGCPVLTVNPSRMQEGIVEIRRILCPVDFSHSARAALDVAGSLAQAFDAELIVMHVAEEPSPTMLFVEETLRRWVPAPIRNDSRYKEIVAHGDVSLEILRAADSLNADLIAIGAERRRFGDTTVFGANARNIMRNARQAVLTLSGLQPRQIRFARRLRASA